jgi:hypothetical protein
VVTNRAGATILPGAAYDGYADRGESENRNKELKIGLQADRLSDHRYFANLFRLYLHATAYNLLVHMRRVVADPPPEPTGEEVPDEAFFGREELPVEALAGRERRSWHNRRRNRDPLGEGQPCTWRTRLIKVGARVRETSRRVVVELSASWPYLNHFQQVVRRLSAISSAAPNSS